MQRPKWPDARKKLLAGVNVLPKAFGSARAPRRSDAPCTAITCLQWTCLGHYPGFLEALTTSGTLQHSGKFWTVRCVFGVPFRS